MKKCCAILMSVLMIFTCVSALTVSAADIGAELISNGGFETVSSGKPQGMSGFGTANITLQSSVVHAGSYAAKIVTTAGGNPFFSVNVAVEPRCQYEFSMWYKGTTDSGGISAKFEQYGTSGSVGSAHAPAYFTANDWTKVTYSFYANDGATSLVVMPRLYATVGEVYIDDISFKKLSGPIQFKFDTDRIFYYENYANSTATVTMDPYYSGNYTVDFSIRYGSEVRCSVNDVAITNYSASAQLDITGLDKKRDYKVYAEIFDSSNTKVETKVQTIARYDRPKALNENNVYIKDGKPFYPSLIYHHPQNDAEIEQAVAAGINVMQNTSIDTAFLDKCYEKGMMVLQVMYFGMKPAGHPDNVEAVKTVVNQIKDHPALYGYMIMDEPWGHYEDPMDYLTRSYKVIRSIDDVHPVYVLDASPNKYELSAKCADILTIDPYPGNGGDYGRMPSDYAVQAVDAVDGEKPVYSVLQAFTFGKTKPTAEQLRSMMFQSLMGGTQGIGFYPWEAHEDENGNELEADLPDGEYWPVITDFKAKDADLMWAFYGGYENPEKFNTYKDNNAWYDTFLYKGELYVVAINRDSANGSVTVPLKNTSGVKKVEGNYSVSVINGGNISSVTKGTESITIALTPYQSVIYKVTADSISGEESSEITTGSNLFTGAAATFDTGHGWDVFNVWDKDTPANQPVVETEGGNSYFKSTVACGLAAKQVSGINTTDEKVAYLLEFDYQLAANTQSTVDFLYSCPTANGGWVTISGSGGNLPASPSGWSHFSKMLILDSENGARSGNAITRFYNQGGNFFTVDNVSLKEIKGYFGGKNLIPNGSFEIKDGTSGIPGYTTHIIGGGSEDRRPVVIEGVASQGNNCIYQAAWGGKFWTTIPVAQGTTATYILEYDYKQNLANHIWCKVADDAGGVHVDVLDEVVSDNWTRQRRIINVTNFAGTYLSVEFTGRLSDAGKFWMDNLSLVKVENTEYSITYNANGGTGNMGTDVKTYGENATLALNKFEKPGYTFKGWSTSAGGTVVYGNGATVNVASQSGTKDLTLYAVWEANTYTVTYNANGGTGSMNSSAHTYGVAKALSSNAFTRERYSFKGWALTPAGSVMYEDGESVINLTAVKGGTVSLYAVWGKKVYGDEMINNGDFENSVELSSGEDWKMSYRAGWGATVADKATILTEENGNSFARITNHGSSFTQVVNVPKGTTGTYYFGFDYKVANTSAQLLVRFWNGSTEMDAIQNCPIVNSDEWNTYGTIIKLDNYQADSFSIEFCGARGKYNADIDNVTMYKLDNYDEENLFVDQGFELLTSHIYDNNFLASNLRTSAKTGFGGGAGSGAGNYIVRGGTIEPVKGTTLQEASSGSKFMWRYGDSSVDFVVPIGDTTNGNYYKDSGLYLELDLYKTGANHAVRVALIKNGTTGAFYPSASGTLIDFVPGSNPDVAHWRWNKDLGVDLTPYLKNDANWETADAIAIRVWSGPDGMGLDNIEVRPADSYIKIADSNGEEITSLPETAEDITIKAKNFSGSAAKIMVATYEKGESGKDILVSLKPVDIKNAAYLTTVFKDAVKGTGKTVKIFMWSAKKPIVEEITLK